MPVGEYVGALKWLGGADVSGFSMEEGVKDSCEKLLKGDKNSYIQTITVNNGTVTAEPRLDKGRCLILINNVTC
jgi:hypothetical protein